MIPQVHWDTQSLTNSLWVNHKWACPSAKLCPVLLRQLFLDLIVDNRGYSTPHPLMSCNENKLPSGHAEPVPRSRAKPEQFLATRAGTTVSRCVNFGRNTLEGWNMMET